MIIISESKSYSSQAQMFQQHSNILLLIYSAIFQEAVSYILCLLSHNDGHWTTFVRELLRYRSEEVPNVVDLPTKCISLTQVGSDFIFIEYQFRQDSAHQTSAFRSIAPGPNSGVAEHYYPASFKLCIAQCSGI